MSAAEMIEWCFIEQRQNANMISENDYMEDGLWYCGECHKPKQERVEIGDFKQTLWCVCGCQSKNVREYQEKIVQRERAGYVNILKSKSRLPKDYDNAVFEQYKVRKENEKVLKLARNYVYNFEAMKQDAQGLLFYGPLGTGKTYTAACIANALMEKFVPVIMTSFVEILKDIQGKGKIESEYMDTLNSATMLIIDDLGAERNSTYAVEKVYSVIDRRVRSGKPMILTTNLKVQEMLECQDISLRRIYDRIFEKCYPVEILGTSFRLEEAARRQARMKALLQ